jgi:hypothetical protein
MVKTKLLAAVAAFALLVLGVPAFAQSGQSSGTTSGPAAGSNVQPSTATQKQAGNKPSVAVGAPGVAAKKGSESGAKPKKGSSPD